MEGSIIMNPETERKADDSIDGYATTDVRNSSIDEIRNSVAPELVDDDHADPVVWGGTVPKPIN